MEELIETAEAVPFDAPILRAVEGFRRFPEARFLAVIDSDGRPLGAVHEQKMRHLLFSPFGHALLGNPGCRWTLAELVQSCPVAEWNAPTDRLLAAFSARAGAEGLILTHGGRYRGLLPAMSLLQLAAERERDSHRHRLAEAEAAANRGRALQTAFDAFRAEALDFGGALARAAADIGDSAAAIAERAALNGTQATAVAAASVQAAQGVKEIAHSSGSLAEHARAIDGQARHVKAAVSEVVRQVSEGDDKTRYLAAAADEIGGVVSLISGIAARVNLLAINARIEAARAGEAGRGFAVVAGEVKALAVQAGKAATQIEGRIGTMRSAVAESTAVNREIGRVIAALDDVAASISDAAGRQSQASAMIAHNVEQAAVASADISGHVADLGGRAASARALSVRMRDIADALLGTADQLCTRVDGFLDEIGMV